MTRAKEEADRKRHHEQQKRKVHGCLDPLTKDIITFEDEEDLEAKIRKIYRQLDEDDSGGLNYEEFSRAVRQVKGNVHLTRDDFDIITENGRLLGPTMEFNEEQFETMMKKELWRYSRRELANVLQVSGNEQFNSTILMLKIMECSSEVHFKKIHSLLTHIVQNQNTGRHARAGLGASDTPRDNHSDIPDCRDKSKFCELVLVAKDSPDACKLVKTLGQGMEDRVMLRLVDGKAIGLETMQPENAWDRWQYFQMVVGQMEEKDVLQVRLDEGGSRSGGFIVWDSPEHGSMVFDVARWHLSAGNPMKPMIMYMWMHTFILIGLPAVMPNATCMCAYTC